MAIIVVKKVARLRCFPAKGHRFLLLLWTKKGKGGQRRDGRDRHRTEEDKCVGKNKEGKSADNGKIEPDEKNNKDGEVHLGDKFVSMDPSDAQYVCVEDVKIAEDIYGRVGDMFHYPCVVVSSRLLGQHGREIKEFCVSHKMAHLRYTLEAKRHIWRKPQKGYNKLNVYGDMECMGGLVRDEKGDWVIGYVYKIFPKMNHKLAKIRAIKTGLELAADNDLELGGLETDGEYTKLVKLTMRGHFGDILNLVAKGAEEQVVNENYKFLTITRELLLKFNLQVSMVHKDANFCAKRLAKQSALLPTSNKTYVVHKAPAILTNVLYFDTLSTF